MGSKNQTSTTVQKSDPWSGAQPGIAQAISAGQDLFAQGGFSASPYSGQRVADQSAATLQAQDMMMAQAGQGSPLASQASGALSQMMDSGYQTELLERVKSNALGSAVPAAMAQFAGSGMTNSGAAMDTVSRAATEAVAPIEYGAMNNMQTNALRAAAMAPGLDQAGYMPAQMMGQVGAAQDAYAQNLINSDMQQYYEGEMQAADNLSGFANMMMGAGGLGGNTTGTSTIPGATMGQRIGGSALGGLGAFGALSANPVTAPFAIAGGLGSALLGLF